MLGRAAGLFIVRLEGRALRAQGGERGGSLSRADRKLRKREALGRRSAAPAQPDGAGAKGQECVAGTGRTQPVLSHEAHLGLSPIPAV